MQQYIDTRGLRIRITEHSYKPREDSFLMIDQLRRVDLPQDLIAEIGPGTGIISLSLMSKETTVLAVDVAPHAARLTHENAQNNGFDNFLVVLSSLVRPFRRGAIPSHIIFNPPYLPEDPEVDPYTPQHELYQLVGGPKGYETVSALVASLEIHNVTLYTFVSSLASNPIEFAKLHPEWNCQVVATENMGFETLWLLKMEGKR